MTVRDIDCQQRLESWHYLFGYLSTLPGVTRKLTELANSTSAPADVRDLAAELAKPVTL